MAFVMDKGPANNGVKLALSTFLIKCGDNDNEEEEEEEEDYSDDGEIGVDGETPPGMIFFFYYPSVVFKGPQAAGIAACSCDLPISFR